VANKAAQNGHDVKILYILGSPRCGSTLLDNIFNEIDGFVSVGEMRFLWQRILEDRWCGCRRPFDQCPLWSAVLERGWGWPTTSRIDPRVVVRWQRQGVRERHTWKLLRARHLSLGGPERAYADVVANLYRGVADLTGARVIVDSSKRPSHGALLRFVDGVSVYYLHLLRDPRAVAYSLSKGKRNPDRSHYAEMARSGPIQGSALWAAVNIGAEAVCRANPPERVQRVSYEDFVRDPVAVIKSTIDMLDEEIPTSPPWIGERTVRLRGNHTVSGNPSRFELGDIDISEDERWKSEMSGWRKAVVSLATAPVLPRFGYPIFPGRQRHGVVASLRSPDRSS
jgi:hypothetical protein